jgi:hypothetical protein
LPLNPYVPPVPLDDTDFHITRGPDDMVNFEVGPGVWSNDLVAVGVGSGNVRRPVPVVDRSSLFTRAPSETTGTLGPWLYKNRRADESGTHEFMYISLLSPGCRFEEARKHGGWPSEKICWRTAQQESSSLSEEGRGRRPVFGRQRWHRGFQRRWVLCVDGPEV